jgi:glucosamine-6-phosphate deaminase
LEIILLQSPEDAAIEAARRIKEQINEFPNSQIGLATGSTQTNVYRALISNYKNAIIDFSKTHFYMLDEYVGLHPENSNSFYSHLMNSFLLKVGLNSESLERLDGNSLDLSLEAQRFEQVLENSGGIDLQLLGIGTNGHIAFNEPGSLGNSRTRVVQLLPDTIKTNSQHFVQGVEIPKLALTQGLGTISEAKSILLVATGKAKAKAIHDMVHGPVTSDCPASFLQNHPNVTVILDDEAASLLTSKQK